MDPRRRQELARYGAPAAFLAAVTIVVILVKAGLSGGSETTTTVGLFPTTTTTRAVTTTKLVITTPQGSTVTTTETNAPGAEYYEVKSGDTLGSIADTYSTTVDDLMSLNPSVDPTSLHIGQKIRVK